MQPLALMWDVLSAIAARIGGSADASHSVSGDGYKGWILPIASLLVVVAAGRLTRGSAPELTTLLNQSAAFYRRWPEPHHGNVPPAELVAEAVRCQRIIQLLAAGDLDGGPAAHGPIDGLHAWIALLHRQIDPRDAAPWGPAYV